ncbi:hypothetical protein Ga0061061_106269 [Chelatococcus sambhunathii]|uniref:Uncharacterized protein n=3 Tax=Chelatococcaceae TaxID=2036754 RepID=A0ABM9U6I1_9HYPH|nr:hypothetical protein Ga0061061_106269 [Chelatococcus sambhunathii]
MHGLPVDTHVEIDFDGMASSRPILAAILQEIDHLQQAIGLLATCRIVVRTSETGGHYGLTLQLALPQGTAVTIHTPASPDARYADPQFAVSDSFRHALARLRTPSEP